MHRNAQAALRAAFFFLLTFVVLANPTRAATISQIGSGVDAFF